MKTLKITFVFVLILSISVLNGQQKHKIKIEDAPFSTKSGDSIILTKGDGRQVKVSHNGIDVWADQINFFPDQNFIEAYNNVKVNQGDSITLNSKYVEYSAKTQFAVAKKDVVLTNPDSKLTTQILYFDRLKQEAFYNNNGKVVRDSSGTITSKIGRYYLKSAKYQFIKKVVLINPDYTIHTNRLDFFSNTGLSYLFGPSTITTDDSKTYCERGFFDTEKKIGYAVKNSKIYYENRVVEGDSLFFDNNRQFSSASNNIKVTDTINNAVATGHYAEVYKAKDSLILTKRALAITVQEKDSIYLHSDVITVTGKPDNRITRAYYNAKLFKSDLSGKADSIHVSQKTGVTTFLNLERFSSTDRFSKKRKPILWNLDNQMTGDTIQLIANTKTEQLDSLKVYQNAFIISKDTVGTGFNQIIGKKLIGLFENNTLKTVEIIKNAESIFYAYGEENNELLGIDRSLSGKMKIFFNNKTVERLDKIGRPDGAIYPEEEFTEDLQKFKDFSWRENERPKQVEDLFLDDPPLKLPIIKGLVDAIPGEDFFDKELLERIEKAGEDKNGKPQSTKVNKAARSLPKPVLNKRRLNKKMDLSDKIKLKKQFKNTKVSPKKK